MKQNCWGNDTYCWGSEAICVGEMPQIQSEGYPEGIVDRTVLTLVMCPIVAWSTWIGINKYFMV